MRYEVINSKANSKVKFAVSLKDKKYRKETNMFLCEGYKNLLMAIETDLVVDIFSTKKMPDLECNGKLYLVNDEVMNKLSSEKNPEGIVFVAKMPTFKEDLSSLNKIVYLDEINDPGNLGTIIRTALAFDYDAVVLSEDCCDPYNEKVISATKGSIFKIPVFKCDLFEVKKSHQIISSTLNEKSIDYSTLKVDKKFALVLGNEAHGISQKTESLSDYFVKIPISNKIDSLNVSVAGAILMQQYK